MDGRGRLLRSVKFGDMGFAPAALAYAGALRVPDRNSVRSKNYPPLRQPRRGLRHRILNRLAGPGTGICFSLVIFLIVGAYGIVKGGHYEAFVASEGHPAEVIAKALGFSIKAVTIAGEQRNQGAGYSCDRRDRSPQFAPVPRCCENQGTAETAAARQGSRDHQTLSGPAADRNRGAPAVCPLANATATSRSSPPTAFPIATMRDQRFIHLPLVVGAGANDQLHPIFSAPGRGRRLARTDRGRRAGRAAPLDVENRQWN